MYIRRMAELDQPPSPTPADGSALLSRLAVGASAYVWGSNFLYLVTKGGLTSPDRWENVYLVILAAYAGGQEVRSWAKGAESGDESWKDRVQKGGPIITAWVSLLFIAGVLRQMDATFPMPPELESITIKVIGLFLGTYMFRQYRRARPLKRPAGEEDEILRVRIADHLRSQGATGARALSDTLDIPPRTLARLLKIMISEKRITREGTSPTDPSATYRAK